MPYQIIQLLRDAAEKWPDSIAIYHNDKSISFSDLFEKTELLSDRLQSLIHSQGHGIALLSGNNNNFINGLFAASSAGFVVMPVWKNLTASEIESALKQSSINLLLIEKSIHFVFKRNFRTEQVDNDFNLIIFSEDTSENITAHFPGAAFIRPSSGTTGNSKGVVISHEAVLERIEAANMGLLLNENDKVLWVLPMAFHFIVSICLYIRYGAAIIICDDFLSENIIDRANKFKATMLYASPLHYRLLSTSTHPENFLTLKQAISTSAGLENQIIQNFQNRFHVPLSQAYGIIEIGLPLINPQPLIEKQGSVGKPVSTYEAVIFDMHFNELAANKQGMLALKGPGMFSGYLWPFQKAEDILHASWFLTGDTALIDENGFINILGRSKSVINVSGNKVFPEEVEAVLLMHPEIQEAYVYRGSHPLTGELVIADIILHGKSVVSVEELISHCRKSLATFKIPQRINFVSDIEKTKTGKLIRK